MKIIRVKGPSWADTLYSLERKIFGRCSYEMSFIKRLLLSSRVVVLLALADNVPIGYSAGECAETGHIITLGVLPSWQGKGAGSKLLEALEQLLYKECRAKSIVLEVKKNNERAISFYRKHGYNIRKMVIGYYGSGNDGYVMSKTLST